MSLLVDYTPPPIAPVLKGTVRLLWSVIIPTFNCAKYLRQTLESVLAQDLGEEQMQIEVVDDCSTKDDPEAVVREVGKGRVTFYRKPKNEGAISNFNTCIQRSRGHLVHILHGDDYVLPGFYKQLERSAATYPNVAGFFTRCFVVNENGDLDCLTDNVAHLETPSNSASDLLYHCDIRTPSAVLRRSFYEVNGGFLPQLVHVADWEMWLRCITLGGGLFINWPLACYRSFKGNDTGRLAKTAENVKDYMRLYSILSARVPNFDHQRFIGNVANIAHYQKKGFEASQNLEAAQANHAVWEQLVPPTPLTTRIRLLARATKSILRQR